MRGAFQHDNCPSAVVRLPIQHSWALHRVFAKYLIAPILLASLDRRIDRAPARRHHLGGHPGVWLPFCSGEARVRHATAALSRRCVRYLHRLGRPPAAAGAISTKEELVRRFGVSELARPYAECASSKAPLTQPMCPQSHGWVRRPSHDVCAPRVGHPLAFRPLAELHQPSCDRRSD
jgi:hypothetical protein